MLYDITIVQFSKMLQNLNSCLDKAAALADAKKFDVGVLLHSRLAPDQFDFMRQLQIACDTAKNGVARVTGKDAPSFEDNEKTLAEAKVRIEKTLAFLKTVSKSDFSGTAERRVSQPRWNGKYMMADEFAVQHMIPNFFFHVTTAYSILRHNGVEVGKKDYLGPMPLKDPS